MARLGIVEPRSAGRVLVERAAAAGHETVLFSADRGGRVLPPDLRGIADRVEVVDTNDEEALLQAAEHLHRHLPLDAVLPGFEYYVPVTAALATRLGLPGLPVASAHRLLHKHLMRRALEEAGVDQPRFAVLTRAEDVPAALAHVGLPCVVKPVAQCGSLHVRKASTPGEAVHAFEVARTQGDPVMERCARPEVLLEEYVRGAEVSVEGFVQDGRAHVVSVTSKALGPEPHFGEVGHIVPAPLPATDERALERYVDRVVTTLGIDMGVFHAEARLTDRGPMLMEVAGRLPGDHILRLLQLARGLDLADIMVQAHLGRHVDVTLPPFQAHAGVRYFLRPDLGEYRRASVRPGLVDGVRIVEHSILQAPGVLPSVDSSRTRLGYAIATGRSHHEVAQALAEADRSTVFQ